MFCTQGDMLYNTCVTPLSISTGQDRYISGHEGDAVHRMDLNEELWNNASDPENSLKSLSHH